MRTTSSLEALNSIIQRSFPGQTTIFKFIEALKLLESIKSTDLNQLFSSKVPTQQLERKRTADKQREKKIKHLTKQLKEGKISVAYFLESMSGQPGKDILPQIGTALKRS